MSFSLYLSRTKRRGNSERMPLQHPVNGGPGTRRTSTSPGGGGDALPTNSSSSSSNGGSRHSLERKSCLSRSSSSEDEHLSPVVMAPSPAVHPRVELRRAIVVEGASPTRATLVGIRSTSSSSKWVLSSTSSNSVTRWHFQMWNYRNIHLSVDKILYILSYVFI